MSSDRYPCPQCGSPVTRADALCPHCGQPLPVWPTDPLTVIYPQEDEAPAVDSAAIAPEETPRDSSTAILMPEDRSPAADSEDVVAEGMPRDVATDSFIPEAEAPAAASDAVVPDESAPPEVERPLPPELTPLEAGMPALAEPPVPSAHTPPSGMTTPFPPEEIEAEARLPFEQTDRSQSPPVAATQPRLHDEIGLPSAPPDPTTPHRLTVGPPRFVPPPVAPPPPALLAPPAPAYSPPPAAHPFALGLTYLQQRAHDYLRGGYRLRQRTPTAVTLSRGKSLGAGGWLLALLTGIGFAWYLLILLFSGFRADQVYITLERDGLVYEDGSGAAHVRRARARAGQRWALFGVGVFVLSLLLALMLGAVAAVYLRTDTHQAALREAYPAITLFEERFSAVEADPDDVALARDGFVAWVILAGVALVGMWGGATMFVVGTIHHGAHRVPVPPLPGWD